MHRIRTMMDLDTDTAAQQPAHAASARRPEDEHTRCKPVLTLRRAPTRSPTDRCGLVQLSAWIEEVNLKAGQELYREDATGFAVYYVQNGVVKLTRAQTDGTQQVIRLVGTKQLIGIERMSDRTYRHTAVALQEVTAYRIPLHELQFLARTAPDVQQWLQQCWNQALIAAELWDDIAHHGSAKARIARLLLFLAENARASAVKLIGRKDIGTLLNVATETASRIVAEYKRKGYLQAKPGRRVVMALPELRKLATSP